MSTNLHKCYKCGELKPTELMSKNGSKGIRNKCKPCHAKYVTEWKQGKTYRIIDKDKDKRQCSKCGEKKTYI